MLVKRGVRDTPNVVQIGFMRTDVKPWAMDYAEAVAGSPAVRRKARIDMPACGATRRQCGSRSSA
jgi:hypothetical protein